MRVVFFGTAAFAVPAIKQITGQHKIVLCITQPDRPQGRGLSVEASSVKQAALALNIPLAQPQRLTLADVASVSADIGVVAAYGQLIRREVIDHFPHGILGIHPSLLPKFRGAAPVAWAILSGETMTGVTIFRINEALDAGPTLLRREVAIGPHESAETLTERLAEMGAEETLRAMEWINSGEAVFTPQAEAAATLAPKLSKSQCPIDWTQPAIQIDRQVRALIPWPGAVAAWQGQPLKIWQAEIAAGKTAAAFKPGSVVDCSGDQLVVATGDGALAIQQLQLPGKKKVTAKEFLSGYRVSIGDRF